VNPRNWTTDHPGRIPTLPVNRWPAHLGTIPIPAFGASTHFLIRMSQSFLKLSLTQPLQTPFVGLHSDSVRTPLATVIGATSPDWPLWTTPVAIQPTAKSPFRIGLTSPRHGTAPRSHGHHVTIVQPCVIHAASLADHLAAVLGPEGSNLFPFNLFYIITANASLIAPQWSYGCLFSFPNWRLIVCAPVPVRIPVPSSSMWTVPQLQILSCLCSDSICIPATL